MIDIKQPELNVVMEMDMGGLPTVVPAECILYFNPDCFMRRWTSAICAETEAVGVPIGIKQKSAVHFGGVERLDILSLGDT